MKMFILLWLRRRSPQARLWLISFAFWTFFALTNFILSYFRHPASLPWYSDFSLQLLFWYLHIPGLPIVNWLWNRFPVVAPHRVRSFLMHCLFSVVFVFAFCVMRVYYDGIHPFHILGTDPAAPFVDRFTTVFRGSITIMFFDYWAFLGAVLAVDYYQKFREREKEAAALQLRAYQLETQLTRAQLQALRMQLNPHFLFNTLHSISALVREDNKVVAIKMIKELGDLLRQTLQLSGSQEVTLNEELQFVKKYLDLEQLRFQDRLHIEMTIQPDTLLARVPYLILQPLVENAIQHGISKCLSASRIEVSASKENGNLILEVRDDGPGFPPDWKGWNGSTIGLANTRARLESLYQNEYRFELKNASEGGAVATITIPFTIHQSDLKLETSRVAS
ncbi:MAG TPA: histidine kinase [Acidobacteriota bacterium]|nr:histidine kinase [Acidobacteriota bacterium]